MEGYSEKTGPPCEEGEHRAAVKLAQPQKENTSWVYACVGEITGWGRTEADMEVQQTVWGGHAQI